MNRPDATLGSTELFYQRDRPLAAVPGYAVGLQVTLTSGEGVYLALAATEFVVYFQNNLALHFDLEARLVKVAEPNQYWRRSLSHRVVFSRKRPAEEGGGLERVVLAEDEADRLVEEANRPIRHLWEEWRTGHARFESGKPNIAAAGDAIRPLLQRVAQFNVAAARADAGRFTAIYRSVAVLPPNEYNALVLQATEGCSYNHCAFCQLYQGVRYRAKSPAEFAAHIAEVVRYHGETLRARRSLFLGEANALALPQRDLVADFQLLREQFELPAPEQTDPGAGWWLGNPRRFDGVGSFLDVFTGAPRPATDWAELYRLGLRRVYIGLESGADNLLRWLRKPATADAVIRTVTTLKEARLNVGVIVLLGAGGQQLAASHVAETVRVLNALPLSRGDYIYLSPLVIYPGGPYDATALADRITALTPAELDAQEQAIRRGLRLGRQGSPYVARYDLETFTY